MTNNANRARDLFTTPPPHIISEGMPSTPRPSDSIFVTFSDEIVRDLAFPDLFDGTDLISPVKKLRPRLSSPTIKLLNKEDVIKESDTHKLYLPDRYLRSKSRSAFGEVTDIAEESQAKRPSRLASTLIGARASSNAQITLRRQTNGNMKKSFLLKEKESRAVRRCSI
mmetsp:Transcript_15035/g.23332  ORF Transcript_15035/g.23332 Transcript_15035/m.23332 type:complete len:168 (-) Transcript_15035:81-584(-)|eukprot:CAMPEP_0196808702 /NCGR_PEP_ID=MMETSP1362-20130617/8699_1 /TAXON_ID=163516 /ORGANISM="Leptocylindrus danicus, Strain CCMP1856" /LENGTH=167 /DNA_ID=CAMNT_0042183123 /DNA_START=550 /DNA_END=1053 /DNA_ORIENTATION=-